MPDPTERFSDRVGNYALYRPSYPREIVSLLRDACGLSDRSAVADVGSGTGIFSRLLRESGCVVYGVEPNDAMRAEAERSLAAEPRFVSVAGTAEATTLDKASVDLIVAAQSFHWFEVHRCGREWRRILRRPGFAAIVWNDRRPGGTPFLAGYEAILDQFGTDYHVVRQSNEGAEKVKRLFVDGRYSTAVFPHEQRLDLAGLRGRLLSSSYVPAEDDPRSAPMLAALEELFHAHAKDGHVAIAYDATIHYGQLV